MRSDFLLQSILPILYSSWSFGIVRWNQIDYEFASFAILITATADSFSPSYRISEWNEIIMSGHANQNRITNCLFISCFSVVLKILVVRRKGQFFVIFELEVFSFLLYLRFYLFLFFFTFSMIFGLWMLFEASIFLTF